MSEELKSGIHPDADSLNAFIEGVLPEHERVQCLTHLADCAQCREIVYLAQQGVEMPEPIAVAESPLPFWRRLFRPMPVTAAIAMAAIVAFSVGIYRMIRAAEPRREGIAITSAMIQSSPPPPQPRKQEQEPQLVERKASPQPAHRERALPPPPAAQSLGAVDAIQPVPAPPPPIAAVPPVQAPQVAVPVPTAPRVPLATAFRNSNASEGAGISGTVTDPAGGVIPRAQIEVKNEATGATYTSTSDTRGQYSIAGLVPGRYDLSITSSGFMSYARPSIDVQPQTTAKVDSTLQVGSVAEAVTVDATASLLKSESGPLVSAESQPLQLKRAWLLPGNRPPVTFATKDKIVVAADAEGSLFFSGNTGKSWKRINGKWKGKVIRVISPPNVPASNNLSFELITDSASMWLSADGQHWSPAPASR